MMDIEPGTVGSWEAMRVIDNGGHNEKVIRTPTRSSTHGVRACRPLWDYLMKNTIELAAEVIRRAAFVDAHALLKDVCGVEGECEELRKTISLVSLRGLLPPPLGDSWTD
jgi:hypothetical protein